MTEKEMELSVDLQDSYDKHNKKLHEIRSLFAKFCGEYDRIIETEHKYGEGWDYDDLSSLMDEYIHGMEEILNITLPSF